MIPIKSNSTNKGCTPVSSNCVMWQGPCLTCINVNTGDTISDVIFEIAELVCSLQADYGISDLDLKCLFDSTSGSPEPEKTIANILELLITKTCSLEDAIDGIIIPGPSAEIIVTIAPCFQVTDLNGDLVTTMKVSDYVKAIGIKFCNLQTLVNQHSSTLSNHETRITNLESLDPDIILPQVTPDCVLTPGVPAEMNVVLEALESQFCQLRSVTGQPTALSQAIGAQCVNLNSSPALSQGGTMSGISGWKNTVSTVADSLNNMWLTICDMRAAVGTVQNCCSKTCNDITVNFLANVADNGAKINLYFSGYTFIPTGFTDCTVQGSKLTITDGLSGSHIIYINLVTESANTSPISVDIVNTPLNPTGTYTFTLESCLTNTTLTCNKTVVKIATGTPLSCSVPTNVTATII